MPASETREATISLPISEPAVLEQFHSAERLSQLFAISVLVNTDTPVDFFPHLGKPTSIKVFRDGEDLRAFHGLITGADHIDGDGSSFRYHLTLRPWLYTLGSNLDYAIFQDQSALDIIKAVFAKRACNDVDYTKLSGSFAKREYCVQYRESDFAFVSRLMEEEGIYYYFKHDDDRHVLILGNARSSHDPSAYPSLPYISPTGGMQTYKERVWRWSEQVSSLGPNKVTLRNFDFTKPDKPVEADYSGGDKVPLDKAEVYDYPAAFLETAAGATLSQHILESARHQRRTYSGEGDAMALACGELLKIADHPVPRLDQEYIVVGLSYSIETQQYSSGGGSSGNSQVSIEAAPADNPWRAPMTTPRPVARGPETAVVTGPAGETIYTDQYGRVKVRFHWDRAANDPEKSTCFIRVSHNSAGAGFGNIILPRIGQEVIVDFLDGDPDRPMITGRIYNAKHMQTYGLPDNKSRSVWRSQTIGKTGQDYANAEDPPPADAAGKNEIRMEDLEGKEEFYVHAQRDRKTDVRRDDSFKLGRSQTVRIGYDRKTAIKRHDAITIEEGDETHIVDKGKRTTTVQDNDSLTVKQGNLATDVKMGNYSIKVDAGTMTIEAMQKITLKVGQSTITIDPLSVAIEATMITVKAKMQLSAEGLMTELKGNAMMTIKGGLVMIN